MEVSSRNPIKWIRLELNLKIEITCGKAPHAWRALPLQPDMLGFRNSFRNLDIQTSVPEPHMAARIDFRNAQRDLACRTIKRILKVDEDFCVVIFSSRVEFGPAGRGRFASPHFSK